MNYPRTGFCRLSNPAVILSTAGDPAGETTRSANRPRALVMLNKLALHATIALYGRAGPVSFGSRPKSNQKRLPLLPA